MCYRWDVIQKYIVGFERGFVKYTILSVALKPRETMENHVG